MRAPWRPILLAAAAFGICIGGVIPFLFGLVIPPGLVGPSADLDVMARVFVTASLIATVGGVAILWGQWRVLGRRPNLRRLRRYYRRLPVWGAVVLILGAALVGFLAGFRFHRQQLMRAERAIYEMGAISFYTTHVGMIYLEGDYRVAREALRRQVGYLGRLRDRSETSQLVSLDFEIGLAHARLFALENANGNGAEARVALERAEELLAPRFWPDMSSAAVLRRLERIDGGLPSSDPTAPPDR